MVSQTAIRPSGNGSLRVRVYDEIRARIHGGLLGQDEKLVDVDIANRLGVSRMPVREALLQLTHEGYLVGTTRGFMLPRLTATDVANIFEVRRCLEPRAAAHAARDIDEEGMRRLAEALDDAEQAASTGDAELLFQANVRFRSCWLEAVRNDRLASAISRFADHVQVVRLGTLTHLPTQAVVVAGMRKLHEAFVRRDPMAAFDHMTRFIETAEERFVVLTQALEASAMENRTAGQGRT
ncbi:GntR family transcriptional regulator [Mesorhizobium sp. INR15]|uniref:GntR family transcriptional regulator n=1 Tax=Mesorhizobium sp. INR15 TaxID=2654248 RepID=UPI0018965082|nr:GntR family transcriptional regulator [Mesorhizobium sp. INR15]QPC94723.1 FCD domain-containing protein [Mesorhizobium sp. INR15]